MAEVSLGKLWIRFGIDDKDLKAGRARTEKELRALEKRTQQTQQRISQTLGRIAPWLTLSAVILGVGRAFAQMGQDARALEDLRLQSGLSVRSLYELRQAVNETGGTVSDLTSAVTAFDKAILTASRDSRSEAAQAFRELGVSVRDANGNLTTLDQVTGQMAEKFAQWKDEANEAAIAQAVFGGGAQAMLRVLNQGQDGLRRAKDEVDKYGRSVEDVHKAQLEWARQTDALAASWQNFRDRVLGPTIPMLIALLNFLSWLDKKAGDAAKALKGMGTEMRETRIKELNEEIAQAAVEQERLTKILEIQTQSGRANTAMWTSTKKQLDEVQVSAARAKDELALLNMQNELLAETKKAAAPPDANKKGSEPQRLQSGISPDQQRALKEMLDGLQLMQEHLNGLPTQLGILAEVNTNTYDAIQEKITQTIDTINAKYKDQEDTVRRLHNLKLQLAKEEQDAYMQTANMIGSAISSVFAKSKAAAIGETIINTATAIMKTLRDVPWPLNIAQAAAVAAMGAANIAKIRSTSEKGGGGGGAASGAPSQPAAPAQQHALHVQGVDRASLYTGAVVENLISAINEKVQNGVTLISTRSVPV